jgi:hypothetical protein
MNYQAKYENAVQTKISSFTKSYKNPLFIKWSLMFMKLMYINHVKDEGLIERRVGAT